MAHLEDLIAQYLDWRGYLVRRNVKVGKRAAGGWEMELDVVGYKPDTGTILHYEPSLDALSWAKREARYEKKFAAGRNYILKQLFPWLPDNTRIEQIAVLITHPPGRDTLAGGRLLGVDELMAEIRGAVVAAGPMSRNAIPEQFPLLRTLQLSHVGYYRVV